MPRCTAEVSADASTAFDTTTRAGPRIIESSCNKREFLPLLLPGPALPRCLENPTHKWDLSKLAPQLRHALAPSKNKAPSRSGEVRGGAGGSGSATLVFDMSKNHFHRWTCDDVLEGVVARVVTLSTVVYPLPLLARNPMYASHPIFLAAAAATDGGRGGAGGAGQRGVEALETLLTRIVLRPKRELRDRAMELAGRVREMAEEWGRERGRNDPVVGGVPPPVRVVGIHARTYFMKAVSTNTVSRRKGSGASERTSGVAFPFVGTCVG